MTRDEVHSIPCVERQQTRHVMNEPTLGCMLPRVLNPLAGQCSVGH